MMNEGTQNTQKKKNQKREKEGETPEILKTMENIVSNKK